jgi:peptide-methionine (S)-S-oxide reductase
MKKIFLAISSFVTFISCAQNNNADLNTTIKAMAANTPKPTTSSADTATFGTGCFWCTEAVFQQVEGVIKVTSGYSGGYVENPSYKDVCTGTTGHAECLNIVYDPSKVSFDELLEMFWQVHDPTTLNRQGNDVGTQYRSAVFYHNEKQKTTTEKYIKELDKSGAWTNPIVTKLEPFVKFYPAEDYHQNYYNNNTGEGYCQFVIRPKLEKFEKVFKSKLKKH